MAHAAAKPNSFGFTNGLRVQQEGSEGHHFDDKGIQRSMNVSKIALYNLQLTVA
jgi:hypothetical protein